MVKRKKIRNIVVSLNVIFNDNWQNLRTEWGSSKPMNGNL